MKALLVDTDLASVQMLGEALRKAGYETVEANSYEDARRLCSAEQPTILVADVRLGPYNGLQLLLRARSLTANPIAVITCSLHDKVLEAETVRFGGTFLVKPVDPSQLVALIRSAEIRMFPTTERRLLERRQVTIPGFIPDRRVANRRLVNLGSGGVVTRPQKPAS